jgi:hypothetical protein
VEKEQSVKARNHSWLEASRISCRAVKSRCATEWGGWGRLSDDGAGQNNPHLSEDPWGRAALAARTVVRWRATPPTLSGDCDVESGAYEGRMQTDWRCMVLIGKVPSEIPALKPYWGKPAVRNFREGDGDVGFHGESVRAIALPDRRKGSCNVVECDITGWERTRRAT